MDSAATTGLSAIKAGRRFVAGLRDHLLPQDSLAFEKLSAVISPYFRSKRMSKFVSLFSPTERTTILDVGGYPAFWNEGPVRSKITIINTHVPNLSPSDRQKYDFVAGDARSLPFPDNAFDIGFSNSVIEHLFTHEDQMRAAEEIQRVSKHIWVQTPAKWFPVETHLKTPLIHYLPIPWRRKLIRHFTVWGWLSKPTPEDIDAFLKEVQLLTYKDMRSLFTDCKIVEESFLFLTKSYVAIK
jgi:predicted SAM-dependent methyltransferase